jgi:hypothetical protein
MSQPIWKLVWSHDTQALFVDETGVYDPELAILDEYETARRTTRFHVYRVCLEGYKIERVTDEDSDGNPTTTEYLVPAAYETSWTHAASQYVPWFAKELNAIASSAGRTRDKLIDGLCSDDPRRRARAYSDIIGHFGAYEFDQYPLDLTESAVKDWPDHNGKPEITISISDDDDGMVTLYCSDREAARDAQSVLGSRWEAPRDMDAAYACVTAMFDLVPQLEADGYDVDASEWSPPDAQDFAFWSAKCERENGASPEQLRQILGWTEKCDLDECRRVQDQLRLRKQWWTDVELDAYIDACWDAGWILDAEVWIDARLATEESATAPTT